MKKILVAIFLLLGFLMVNKTEAQTTKFYYYPSSNVYLNTASGKYIYSDNGQWTTVKSLPAKKPLDPRRVIVYSNTPEVWKNNPSHVKKYKAVTMKPMPPGNSKPKHQTNNSN